MPQYVDVPKYDENEDIRDYCTCPNCHIIWPHYETAKMPYIERGRWAKEHYGQGPYQCPECGTWSEALEKPGFWQRMRGEYRRIVPPPEPIHQEVDR